MKKTYLLIIPFIGIVGFSLFNGRSTSKLSPCDKEIIVELKDINGTSSEERNLVQKSFISELNNTIGFNYRVTSTLTGCSNILMLNIPSSVYETVSSLNLVDNIRKNKTYEADYDAYSYDTFVDKNGPDQNYSRIDMNIPSTTNDGSGTISAILDDSFNIDHEMFKDLSGDVRYSKTQINSFKNSSGFSGKNAGYKDSKIPFYYSYVTNDVKMTFSQNIEYHGAHVSGILGANNTIIGAAPNTQLALMRVTNSAGGFVDSAIIKALNDCAIMNVDTINMSFGNALYDFDFDSTYASIFNKLKNQGIMTNVAAGNDGKESFELTSYQNSTTASVENGFLGSFSASNSVNSIASLNVIENANIPSSISTKSGVSIRVRDQIINHTYSDENGTTQTQVYDTPLPFYSLIKKDESSITLPYVMIPNLGDVSDYENIDVNNKIAVIERGTLSFVDKVTNAVNNGAIAVLIYNSKGTAQVGYMDLKSLDKKFYVPTGYIKSSDGALLASETDKEINISKEYAASYSSDGSTSDLSLNPDVAAPGTNIYSGIGSETNKYAYYSGTSMASPNLGGAMVNVLSNKTFTNENERSAYRKSLMMRIMSTSDPLLEANGAYYSPRKVGAGKVDVSGAINSQVYLEGNVDGTSKVELKNNDNIKNGKVSFNVRTHNDANATKKYQVKLVIEAPELTKTDDVYTTLKDHYFQTDKDVLLNDSTSTISIPSGTSSLDFNLAITEENKEYLTNFENGTYLEGYAILTSLDGDEDLSIPYMGFYGDYNSETVLEPFNFEKDPSKVYGSDVLNSLCADNKKSSLDFGSHFVGSNSEITTSMINGLKANTTYLTAYGKELTYDTTNDFYKVGVANTSTYLVLQAYINRNCIDNNVQLINKSTNKVVYNSFINNLLDDTSKSSKHELVKSLATSSLISSGYIANRGFFKLNLVSSGNQLLYEEGLYDLVFNFSLASGATQSKTYHLNIVNVDKENPPVILNREIISDNNEKYIRVNFNGNSMNKVLANEKEVTFGTKNSNYYVDLKYSDYSSIDNLVLTFIDIYGNSNFYLLKMSTILDEGYGVYSEELSLGDTLTVGLSSKTTTDSGDAYYIDFVIKNSNESNIVFSNSYNVTFKVPSKYTADSKMIQVYNVRDNGSLSLVNFSLYDGVISTSTSNGQLMVVYTTSNSSSDDSPFSTGTIIGLVVGVGAIALGSIVAIIVIKKIKKKM